MDGGVMRTFIMAALVAFATVQPVSAKNCIKGKPCGNTCIPRDRECHIEPSTPRPEQGPLPSPSPAPDDAPKPHALHREAWSGVACLMLTSTGDAISVFTPTGAEIRAALNGNRAVLTFRKKAGWLAESVCGPT